MAMHFEELWEKCENFQKEASDHTTTQQMIDELSLKINLYKAIDAKAAEIPPEECQKVKSRLLGEILLVISCMSLKDNINVFEALSMALQFRSIEHYSKKHPA
jgi:hypothetical protein